MIRRATLTAVFAVSTVCGAALAEPTILVDAATGEVLSHEDAFQRWYPASLTKLMTLYVVFRAIDAGEITFESPVKLSKRAASQPPSKMFWAPGTQLTFDNALKILAVKSANDIALAVAESLAGSEQAFRERMNAEAVRLGLTDTRFVNPNGLHSTDQYTTARDLAVLSVALRREFPQYARFFSYEGIEYGKEESTNYNILLGRFDGADGMKTGFVCASGFNLVGSATRNGRTLIAVVLGAKSQQARAEIAADLMAAGFDGKAPPAGTLDTLRPSGENRQKARDMRSTVCTETAQSERWDGREVEGKITFLTPNIKPMTRQPQLVQVAIGGATGPVAPQAASLFTADVPVPTPRPANRPDVKPQAALPDTAAAGEKGVEATALQAEPLRPTMGVPVPTPRTADSLN